jgi:hypothetical protein
MFKSISNYKASHLIICLSQYALLLTGFAAMNVSAQTSQPKADFLFIGSYHMNNHHRDVQNTNADDVLAEKRQLEIAEVARLIERYQPTKVMVEVDLEKQETISKNYIESCKGSRALSKEEAEQFGFRIACDLGLGTVYAVNSWDLTAIKDKGSINYANAVERHHQQDQYNEFLSDSKLEGEKDQHILDNGTVLDMLKNLNSDYWLHKNAMAYYSIGMLGTQSDPIGANWVQYWFGRNLAIFNNIARITNSGDRILVIYGAGHGNYLRQLAIDSGIYHVHDPLQWLSQRQ